MKKILVPIYGCQLCWPKRCRKENLCCWVFIVPSVQKLSVSDNLLVYIKKWVCFVVFMSPLFSFVELARFYNLYVYNIKKAKKQIQLVNSFCRIFSLAFCYPPYVESYQLQLALFTKSSLRLVVNMQIISLSKKKKNFRRKCRWCRNLAYAPFFLVLGAFRFLNYTVPCFLS